MFICVKFPYVTFAINIPKGAINILLNFVLKIDPIYNNIINTKELFKNLCQLGKITNTQGNTDEYKNRCIAICS